MSQTSENNLMLDKRLLNGGVSLTSNAENLQIKQQQSTMPSVFKNNLLNQRQFMVIFDSNGLLVDPRTCLKSLCYTPPGYKITQLLTKQIFDLRGTNKFSTTLQKQDDYQKLQLIYTKTNQTGSRLTAVVNGFGFLSHNQLVDYSATKTFTAFFKNYQMSLLLPRTFYDDGIIVFEMPPVLLNQMYYDAIISQKNELQTAFLLKIQEVQFDVLTTIQIAQQVAGQNTIMQSQFQTIKKLIDSQISKIKQEFDQYATSRNGNNMTVLSPDTLNRQFQANVVIFQDDNQTKFQDIIWDEVSVAKYQNPKQILFTQKWNQKPYQFVNLDLLNTLNFNQQPYIGIQGIVCENTQGVQYYIEMLHQQLSGNQLQFTDLTNNGDKQLLKNIQYKGWTDDFGSLPETVFDADYFQLIATQSNKLPVVTKSNTKLNNQTQQLYQMEFSQLNTQIPDTMSLVGVGENLLTTDLYFIYAHDNIIQEILMKQPTYDYYQTYTNQLDESSGFIDIQVSNKNQTVKYTDNSANKNRLISFNYVKYADQQLQQLNQLLQTPEFQQMAEQFLTKEQYKQLLIITNTKSSQEYGYSFIFYIIVVLIVIVILISIVYKILIKRKKGTNQTI